MTHNGNRHFRTPIREELPGRARYFFNFFKTKAKKKMREGVMDPEEVKKLVQTIGKDKKVNITRLTYDGTPEEHPTPVKIIDIREDHFTAKVVNVERSIKQMENSSIIYVKGGGGSIDFFFEDGDIVKIEEDIDEEIVEQHDTGQVKEILEALDPGDEIIISFYDKTEGGVMNGVGVLNSKDMETLDLTVELKVINEIEMREPRVVDLNLNRDNILDLEIVL
jgi:hypothetical protein